MFPELGQIDATAAQPERLKQLSALMTHPENGRFARTMVNRFWHRMMGHGIVHPVDAMQTEPWNTDLLDFLAVDFADRHFDMKQILKSIAMSQAYQSRAETVSDRADSQNYVYSGPRAKRMTAEQFVDAVWQVTDTAPKQFDAPIVRGKAGDATTAQGRMVRASLLKSDFLQRTLGRPNRDQIVTSRPVELSTLEAIDLNNAQVLSESLAAGARNLLARPHTAPSDLVTKICLLMLSRSPTAEELSIAKETFAQPTSEQNVEDLLWAMLMQPEFQLVQ